jgi:hypothetical protein
MSIQKSLSQQNQQAKDVFGQSIFYLEFQMESP